MMSCLTLDRCGGDGEESDWGIIKKKKKEYTVC